MADQIRRHLKPPGWMLFPALGLGAVPRFTARRGVDSDSPEQFHERRVCDMKRLLLALVLAACWWPRMLQADTGFLDRSITLDGETYRFQVYVPVAWTPTQPWPVVMLLHGDGSQGSDGLRHVPLGTIVTSIRDDRERFPAVILFPQARPGTRWSTPAMQLMALAQLDSVMKEFNGDPARVSLTGYSMGASGVIRIASQWPHRFAALVDMSGRVASPPVMTSAMETLNATDIRTHAFLRAPDIYQEAARMIRGIPIWIFHGDADKEVPVEESRRLVAALKADGADVQYTEYPGLDHGPTPGQAWRERRLTDWLFSQRRVDPSK